MYQLEVIILYAHCFPIHLYPIPMPAEDVGILIYLFIYLLPYTL